MINLLDNAIEAMEGRGQVVIDLDYDSVLKMVRVEVADDGPGIDSRNKARLFEPYFSTKKHGTGLGLAIVSTIITDHDGFIRVRGQSPEGDEIHHRTADPHMIWPDKGRCMMILYHFLWGFPLVFFVAVALFSGNKRLRERFALDLPKPLPKDGNLWIHALSVGEVLSAVPLVEQLKKTFPEKDIVFSVATRSGLSMANEKISGRVACVLTLPVDAWWCMRRVIKHVKPSAFILVETDLWPGLLGLLKQKGVRSLLVNGRISPRTLKSYRRAPALVRRMVAPLEYCLMQTDLDRDRLLRLGMDRKRVITVGNIKFDRKIPTLDDEERERWLITLGLHPGMQLWVAGQHPCG